MAASRLVVRRQSLLQRLDHLFRSESHALADSHRGGLVIDAEGNEGHAGSLS